jgi:hypothetical protein
MSKLQTGFWQESDDVPFDVIKSCTDSCKKSECH